MSPMRVGEVGDDGGYGPLTRLSNRCEAVVFACCKAAAGMPLPVACAGVAALLLLGAASTADSVGAVRAVAILLVFVAGLGGAFLPWRLRSSAAMLARGNSLSAGVMLAAGLIHLLGDASRELATPGSCGAAGKAGAAAQEAPEPYPLAMLLCSIGFIVTMVAEGAGHYWQRRGGAELVGASAAAGPSLLLAAALGFHSVLEGLALGVVDDKSEILALLLTILAHKSLAGFALGTSLLRGGTPPGRFIAVGGAFALASPCGAVMASMGKWLVDAAVFAPIVIGLSSGTFLYVGLIELLSKELADQQAGEEGIRLALFMFGWGSMALLALWT